MKKDKKILVVEREILFGNDYFQGFRYKNEVDYERKILENYRFMWRFKDNIENRPELKQIGTYVVIINPDLKMIFAYQRSSDDSKYKEKRLQGMWSWGVGGHIEEKDTGENPILRCMLRELNEEVEIKGVSKNINFLGYINYDDDPVGKVHFGNIFFAETNAKIINPKDVEIKQGVLKKFNELEEIVNSDKYVVESWSEIVLKPVSKYLNIRY